MNITLPKFFILLILTGFLTSCGASRSGNSRRKTVISEQRVSKIPPQNKINTAPPGVLPEDKRVYNITTYALEFEGTRYKYGGTTKEGMDCSGLVYVSFLHENIPLPRSSRDMSLKGERLSLVDVNIGDLLFFETDKNKKVINHVGLVIEIQPGQIYFIHSSTSRGVIISSLSEDYWFQHFVMARRLI